MMTSSSARRRSRAAEQLLKQMNERSIYLSAATHSLALASVQLWRGCAVAAQHRDERGIGSAVADVASWAVLQIGRNIARGSGRPSQGGSTDPPPKFGAEVGKCIWCSCRKGVKVMAGNAFPLILN